MCRNIKPLFNFDPPATDHEIHDAALQYVRKVSGFREPSEVNKATFDEAIESIAHATQSLVDSLETKAEPRDREIEAQKAKERAKKRFGN